MLVYNYTLTQHIGAEGIVALNLLVQLSAAAMRAAMPPFGRYVAHEAQLEGIFRFLHSRLIYNGEEVALLHGHEAEKDTLDKEYFTLMKHVNRVLRRRLYQGIMDDFIIKYFWGVMGLTLCSTPVFLTSGNLTSKIGNHAESMQ